MTSIDIVVMLGSYLIGSIPFGYIIGLLLSGEDVRKKGSGNIGATNVMRTVGRVWGIITLLLDIFKGIGCAIAAGYLSDTLQLPLAAGVFAVIGHCYPIFLKFKGGKGVATSLGVFLYLSPIPSLLSLSVFSVEMLLFRYVSLGSIFASVSFPVFVYYFGKPPGISNMFMAACVFAIFIPYRHVSNIVNLFNGKEKKFGRGFFEAG